MKFHVRLNPLLAYLLKRKQINLVQRLRSILVRWVISSLAVAGMLLSYYLSPVFLCIFPFCTLFYFLTIVSPIACACVAAISTSNSVARQDYELLKLANISDTTILLSYVTAALYRIRGLLLIIIGFAPIIFTSAAFTWAIWDTGFGESSCMKTPVGTTYCEDIDSPVPSQTD